MLLLFVADVMLMPMLAKYSSVSFEMGAAPVKKNLHLSSPMACLACEKKTSHIQRHSGGEEDD